MIKNQIIILKNDAVGDLVHSLNAIDNIISNHTDHKIIIYLSERSKKFSFLIKGKNIEFKFVRYRLGFIENLTYFYHYLIIQFKKFIYSLQSCSIIIYQYFS